jgi:hypothetical protein
MDEEIVRTNRHMPSPHEKPESIARSSQWYIIIICTLIVIDINNNYYYRCEN